MTADADVSQATPTWNPSPSELDDVEMLLSGAYASLPGFLDEKNAMCVLRERRLCDGTPWPVPVTLTVPSHIGELAAASGALELEDEEGTPIACVSVRETWPRHGGCGVAGEVSPLQPIERGEFRALRRPPHTDGRTDGSVLGHPVSRPVHLPERAAILATGRDLGARVLLMPLVGHGAPREVDAAGLVRCCLEVRDELCRAGLDAEVVPVPLPNHGYPERDAALAAVVAGAYGATHVTGAPAHACQEGPVVLEMPRVVQDDRTGAWDVEGRVPVEFRSGRSAADVQANVHQAIVGNHVVPSGSTSPAVEREMRRTRQARSGLVVMFTGLSGSGKSTLARSLRTALLERTGHAVTLLDGDVVRRMLSSGLTFTRADRELNVRRIGFVAAEIARHGGITVCAPIAPYATMRAEVREMVERESGRFVLVHVSTPLDECERRDRKGLYAKARRGEIPHFTGISDPYEIPTDADVVIDTSATPLDDAVETILAIMDP